MLDINRFSAPAGWQWTTEWVPYKDGNTDSEGWRYNFPHPSLSFSHLHLFIGMQSHLHLEVSDFIPAKRE